jgi:hypothetical protein
LKPNYSTSSCNIGSSTSNSFLNFTESVHNYSTTENERSIQLHQLQQGEYTTSNQNNLFAPIGYSRQRSTSLLPPSASQHYQSPPIQHHRQQQQQQRQHELKQNVSNSSTFAPYAFHMPGSMSRMGIGSPTHDHYLNNSRFYPSLDSE